VDQPIGTGFSYSKDPRDIVHDEHGVSEDMYDFLLVSRFLLIYLVLASLECILGRVRCKLDHLIGYLLVSLYSHSSWSFCCQPP
jgi:hypothetical protein